MMREERELIVEYGKKMITSGLTQGTGGNISICDRTRGLMAISPSGMDYFAITPEDVVIMDLAGNVVDGKRKPSVEYAMHSIFYTDREDVNAVLHTHAIACSTMAALQEDLPAVNYMVALSGNTVIPCSKYETFGSRELALSALHTMGKGYACFLGNHGFISAAPNLPAAFKIAEECERCSEIYLRAKAAGQPKIIPDDKLMEMLAVAKKYGQ